MRLFFVIDETQFYHPEFLADFLRNTVDDVVGSGLVTKVPSKNNLERYMREHWYYLRPNEIIKLAYSKYSARLKDNIVRKTGEGPFYSVRSVLQYYNVDFIEIEYDINKKKYLDVIRAHKPDVIISSNPLIFKEELLNVPTICCLNRHSALLPSYGGVWPVFQAYRNAEEYTGVSVHLMTKQIDIGDVLAYQKVPITPDDTLSDLYDKCFNVSADVILKALDKVKNKDFTSCCGSNESSYFSFPRKEHWVDFRKRGGKLV